MILTAMYPKDPAAGPHEATFALPAGTVTFMLTDVQGSVRHWESDPTGAEETMKRLVRIIEETVGTNNGVLISSQGEGDSSLSAFARASDAVAAAVGVQRGIEAEWGEDLKVRIGVHTGEAAFQRDGQYFGRTVNRCARIRDAAHGGQVLVSQATRDLVVDRVADGFELLDLGTHQLRDLAMPEHLWQLGHPDLPATFPPPRTLDALPNNLPRQQTRFIGRDDDVARAVSLLRDTRLATLTGPGGVGKTRLALQVAADVADTFADGAWFVDLTKLQAPASVATAVMNVLDLRSQGTATPEETVFEWLGRRSALLVLDNCEHVIEDAAAFTAGVLDSCPDVRILATSRETLQLPGETSWVVPSLSMPGEEADVSLAAVSHSDAVTLFVDRAHKARPNFVLDERNAATVLDICRRLDGIPLAIELAASRSRLLPVEQIRDGLEDRFRLLTGRARTLMPRQQTLRASVDWSYDLLDEDERRLLQRLSVFATSFTLDAAEQVCSGDGIEQLRVLDLLASLVDKSLVQPVAEGARARYRLLDTIRAYAAEKLGDDADVVRGRMVRAYGAMAEQAAHGWYIAQAPWVAWLEDELPNIEAAVRLGRQLDMPEADKIAVYVARYLWVTARRLLGEAWVREVLDRNIADRLRMIALMELAMFHVSDDPVEHDRCIEEALELARGLGDEFAEAELLKASGFGHRDPDVQVRYLRQSIAYLERSTDDRAPYALAGAQNNLANWFLARGDLDEAEGLYRAALGTQRVDQFGAVLLLNLGRVQAARGQLDEAMAMWEAGLSVVEDVGYTLAGWWLNQVRAMVLAARGKMAEAVAETHAGEARAERWGAVDVALRKTAAESAGARAPLSPEHQIALEEPALVRLISTWGAEGVETGLYSLLAGDPAGARARLDAHAQAASQAEQRFLTGEVAVARALCDLLEGDIEAALARATDAIAVLAKRADPTLVSGAVELFAMVAVANEDHERAARLHGAARSIRSFNGTLPWVFMRFDYEQWIARARDALGEQAFDAAVAQGEALSRDEAITFAGKGRGARKRPTTGWAALSPVELQVVQLIKEGMSNPQIAERMFLSRRTVESHVSNALRKVGLSSRVELATEAARRDR